MSHQPAVWLLQVEDSRIAKKLRLMGAAFFVLGAVSLTLWVSPIGGGIAWWGDWLWVWPILCVGAWQLYRGQGPVLAAQRLELSETGSISGFQISEPLITPYWLAMKLTVLEQSKAQPTELSSAQYALHLSYTAPKGGWQWVFKDQLSAQSWARLRRVCRNVKHAGG